MQQIQDEWLFAPRRDIQNATELTTHNMDVTPAHARFFLLKNSVNRPLRQGAVNRFAGMITRNKMRLTHQGIAFDGDGMLLDGQHRL